MCRNQLLLAGLSTGSVYFLTVPSDHTVFPKHLPHVDFPFLLLHYILRDLCALLGSEGEEARLYGGPAKGQRQPKPQTEEGRQHSAPHQRLLQGQGSGDCQTLTAL